ncbi:MAG: cation:proton antiporter [Alphaproteobacteria bacterium]|nr:cation:proton antiporter [Alphaproteobacteria bacterium]
MHDVTELTGIAIVAVAATVGGLIFVRLRQPAIVGYILAGVILGPSGFELVRDREAVALLAELGVILLLYFIGMELSLRSFRQIWRIAVITTAVQIGASLGVTFLVARGFDWPPEHAVLFGFSLALSSTAVAVKILNDIGELRHRAGRVAIGILIAQDLAVAPMLIIVASTAGGGFNPFVLVEIALSIGILIGVIYVLTRRQRIDIPFHQIFESKPELSAIGSLTICFGIATLAGVLGMSPAFGAFLAGLIVGNSGQRQVMHENAEPIQAVLLMVFFLSIGLLINLEYLWEHIWIVLAIWAFVAVFKTALNVILLRAQGETMQNAFLASLVLGQLGEFTFVLAAAAADVRVIDQDVHRMLVSVTVLSLMTSPLMVDLARRLSHRSLRHAGTLQKILRLSYFEEWRFTKTTSLWFWLVSLDIVERLELALRDVKLSTRARIEARRLHAEATERAKKAAQSGLTAAPGADQAAAPNTAPDSAPNSAPDAAMGTESDAGLSEQTDAPMKQPSRFWNRRRPKPAPGE